MLSSAEELRIKLAFIVVDDGDNMQVTSSAKEKSLTTMMGS